MTKSTFLEHTTYDPSIPSHISRICVASAYVFLFGGILCLFLPEVKYNYFGGTSLAIYTTSMIHWPKPKFESYIRYVDIALALGGLLQTIYLSYTLGVEEFRIWCGLVALTTCAFLTNEVLYHYQVKIPKDILRENPAYDYKIEKDGNVWSCFVCAPTWPNSWNREYCYYRSALCHSLFVHVLLGGTGFVVAFYMSAPFCDVV